MAAFYLDEDAPEALATLLTAFGHAAETTRAEGRKGAADYEQLWHAALHRRIFVTLNRKDYLLLHGAWHHWGVARPHAGILVVPHIARADLPALAAAIDALLSNVPALDNTLHAWTPTAGWRQAGA